MPATHKAVVKGQSLPLRRVERVILVLRGQRVILDRDLAHLYGVTTGNLNKAVSRNVERFPEDFMLQITQEELRNLIFHFGRSSWGGTVEFQAVRELMTPAARLGRRIGFSLPSRTQVEG